MAPLVAPTLPRLPGLQLDTYDDVQLALRHRVHHLLLTHATTNVDWIRDNAQMQEEHFSRLLRIGMQENQATRLPLGRIRLGAFERLVPERVWIFPTHSTYVNLIVHDNVMIRKMVKYSCQHLTRTDGQPNIVVVLDIQQSCLRAAFLPGTPFAPWSSANPNPSVYRADWGFRGDLATAAHVAYPITMMVPFPGIYHANYRDPTTVGRQCRTPQSACRLSAMQTWPDELKIRICRRVTEAYGWRF